MLAECALLAGAAVGDWGSVCGSTLDASQKAAGTATQVIENGALNRVMAWRWEGPRRQKGLREAAEREASSLGAKLHVEG